MKHRNVLTQFIEDQNNVKKIGEATQLMVDAIKGDGRILIMWKWWFDV
jgi:phosphoheptose isomerase